MALVLMGRLGATVFGVENIKTGRRWVNLYLTANPDRPTIGSPSKAGEPLL
jgi:hypothetical protein